MKQTLILAIFLALIVIVQASPISLDKRQDSTSVKASEIPAAGGDPDTSDRTVPTGPNPLHNKK
jgi:hypothetical protein